MDRRKGILSQPGLEDETTHFTALPLEFELRDWDWDEP